MATTPDFTIPATRLLGRQIDKEQLFDAHIAPAAAIATSKLADDGNFILADGTIAFKMANYSDIDPTTVTLPPPGNVYFGSFNNRLWKLTSSGAITYMQKEVTLYSDYTAAGTKSSVTLTYLIGAVGIKVEKGTQTLKSSEFTFYSSTGIITFVVALEIYETIFITYQKNIDL